jgi:hypothetical protein
MPRIEVEENGILNLWPTLLLANGLIPHMHVGFL